MRAKLFMIVVLTVILLVVPQMGSLAQSETESASACQSGLSLWLTKAQSFPGLDGELPVGTQVTGVRPVEGGKVLICIVNNGSSVTFEVPRSDLADIQPLLMTAVPQVTSTSSEVPETPAGDVESWRGAGSDAGCPGYPELTTGFVQDSFGTGIGVFRIANYSCVWGANGTPQQLTFNDMQFEVYDLDTQTVHRDAGTLTLSNFLIVHKASYSQSFDYAAYQAAQSASCERLPEINAQILSEMISAPIPAGQEGLYQEVHLAKNEGEECGFYARHGRWLLQLPAVETLGYELQMTVHPTGDDNVHFGGIDDEVLVAYSRFSPNVVLDAYSFTVRVVQKVAPSGATTLGFNALDAVHQPCLLWIHEYDNGSIENPPFGVYPFGYQCAWDQAAAQDFLDNSLNRPDVTAPQQPTLYGVSWQNMVSQMGGEAATATPFPGN